MWISCRSGFHDKLDPALDGYFDDILKIQPWKENTFFRFVDNYAKKTGKPEIRDRIKDLINNSTIDITFISSPLYATMLIFLACEEEEKITSISDSYQLMDLFVDLWISRESSKNGEESEENKTREETIFEKLGNIALQIYEHKTAVLPKTSSTISDLLVVETNRSKPFVRSFFHREFCIYFIVRGIISTALKNSKDIIHWFSRAYYDDVTNLCKQAYRHCDDETVHHICDNLFAVYKQSYEMDLDIIDASSKDAISKLDKITLLKLHDEIIYFLMQLPGVDATEFFEYAHNHCDNTLISQGLAYGLAGKTQHPYTLEFARKLGCVSKFKIMQKA